jgi:hypothetical protein
VLAVAEFRSRARFWSSATIVMLFRNTVFHRAHGLLYVCITKWLPRSGPAAQGKMCRPARFAAGRLDQLLRLASSCRRPLRNWFPAASTVGARSAVPCCQRKVANVTQISK